MIQLQQQETDSTQFIEMAQRLVDGVLRASSAERVYVVKIDQWFPAKWCQFSGTQHGAIGVWKHKPTLPPFVPSRVVAEAYYELSADESRYEQLVSRTPVHVRQASSDNLNRFVDRVDNGATFLWYSGATEDVGKGCVMAYLPVVVDYTCWYAEILLRGQAKLGMLRGISAEELVAYTEA